MSYDIAIVRSDISDDLVFKVTCDWEVRGQWDDFAGTQCNPTYNYSKFFKAFHVHPIDDLHGKSAMIVSTLIDKALSDIRGHSITELGDAYFRKYDGEPIAWGSIPNAIKWLGDVRDYCQTHPDYEFIGHGVGEDENENAVTLGTIRTFDRRYQEPTGERYRKLLEETAELAAVSRRWLDSDRLDGTLRRHMIDEYCDVVEALGTLTIAYDITSREIRLGMTDCEKRFRDGEAGGEKTAEENTIIDGLEELSLRLVERQENE